MFFNRLNGKSKIRDLSVKLFFRVVIIGLFVCVSVGRGQLHSELWGENGEKWSPQSRLPDFSFAGYQCGEKPIPDYPVVCSVSDFGAKGDGVSDDTQAFKDAIARTDSGAIFIPAGQYRITDFIVIDKPNIVLRGRGPEKTVLWFPKHLTDVKPDWSQTASGKPTSRYSWSGGYFHFYGRYRQKHLADIIQISERGDTVLSVSSVEKFHWGQWVRIQLTDDADKTLTRWLYNEDSGSISEIRGCNAWQVGRVIKIDSKNNTITLDRPLRIETRQQWQPRVLSFQPQVHDSGIEQLSFRFPDVPWKG